MTKKAVVLLSGGLDSTTVVAIAKERGFQPYALSFRYGQRHSVELEAAARVARAFDAVHRTVTVDLSSLGGSALTDDQLDVPKDRDADTVGNDVPITYVPARNTVFLAVALGWAEVLQTGDIFIGVSDLDNSGYPDCRPAFIEAFAKLAQVATDDGVAGRVQYQIHAPLMQMTKADIIKRGIELGVDYSMTHSCYDPSATALACGRCDSCALRRKGFIDAGVADPTRYVNG